MISTPRLGIPIAALVWLVLLVPTTADGDPLVIYDDQLRNDFEDWSWAARDLANPAPVFSGSYSVLMEPDAWGGLWFRRPYLFDLAAWEALSLRVHGGVYGGQILRLFIYLNDDSLAETDLASYLPGGVVPAGAWAELTVPFAALGLNAGTFNGIVIMDWTGGDQPPVCFDELILIPDDAPPEPPAPVAVAIDPGADRRPIRPQVYGVNFGDPTQAAELGFPVRRWGGNATTRYNWRVDVSNQGSDYFFFNIPHDHPNPESLPAGSDADRFIDATRAAGGEVLLTVPTIGWTPIAERVKRWGFSVAAYGPQDLTECDLYDPPPNWCRDDAGNGRCAGVVNPTGYCHQGLIVGNDPLDTSVPIDATFVTDWMTHVAGRVGSAGNGGVRLFALDNEPMLWDGTHRDVHPEPATYDEIWSRTVAIAGAIKAHDPEALVFGPVVWGWCAWFTSAADAAYPNGSCVDGPDRQAHGGLAFLPWYLQQVCAHQAATGVRLVDYLDVHFYPQGGISGIDPGSDGEEPEVAARRLRALRELWDPAWVSESWIAAPVYLIPRLRSWVDQYCPGTRLALTEYRWGSDDGPSAALAQAELLAIAGREGLDLAARWVAPEPGTRTEDAFRLYLSYDGQGARVAGQSVRATSADGDAVGAYAVLDGETLFILLFNHDVVARLAQVAVAGQLSGSAQLYRFDPLNRLGSAGEVAADVGGLELALPARSANLVVVGLETTTIFADGFESGDLSAWQ